MGINVSVAQVMDSLILQELAMATAICNALEIAVKCAVEVGRYPYTKGEEVDGVHPSEEGDGVHPSVVNLLDSVVNLLDSLVNLDS